MANGCSEPDSSVAANRNTACSSCSPATNTSVTFGAPRVMVPVLSRIIAVIFDAVCRASPLRIRTPASAALPTPTITDIGVARPSAQGQAIINTVVADTMANATAGSGPKLSQVKALTTAIIITTGTKYAEMTSAKRPIGGLEFCARLTILMICASAVSLPTRVALNRIEPDLLMVPAATVSPVAFSTGIGSPVSMDSSIAVCPSTTSPSTGIFSPGRTRTTSFSRTCSIAISSSLSSRITRAVFACNPIRRLIASEVRPRAFNSRARPRSIKPIIIAVASK